MGLVLPSTITTTYDPADQVTQISDPDATLNFGYDSGGRMTSARTSGSGTGQPNVTLTYGYNNGNARASLADSFPTSGRTTYSYDSNYRLTTLTRKIGAGETLTVANAYDDASRLTARSRTVSTAATANLTTTYQYDIANRLTTISHARQSGGTTLLATYAYTFDSGGRITRETIDNATATFSYDNTNQLTAADRPGTTNDESYAWDSNGNRTMAGYSTGTENRLTQGGGFTFTYDNAGNITQRRRTADGQTTDYTWDFRNRLSNVTIKNNGGTVTGAVTYTYDALDRRIGMLADSDGFGSSAPARTWVVWDGENPYADVDSAGNPTARYLHGPAVDELLARTNAAGTAAWYLTDHLGSVRAIADTAGTTQWQATYDSFGNLASQSGTWGDRFRYTAREWDDIAQLQYNRARYYDAAIGRWLSLDPIAFTAGDTNLYRYVGNSPVRYQDPSGLQFGGGVRYTQNYPYYQPLIYSDESSRRPAEHEYQMYNEYVAILNKHLAEYRDYHLAQKNVSEAIKAQIALDYLKKLGFKYVFWYESTSAHPDLGKWDFYNGMGLNRMYFEHHEDTLSRASDLAATLLHESYHANSGYFHFLDHLRHDDPAEYHAQYWMDKLYQRMGLELRGAYKRGVAK